MKFPKLAGRLLIAIPGIALFLGVLFILPLKWGLFLFSTLSVLAAWEAIPLCCSTIRGTPRILVSFFSGVSTLAVAVNHPLVFPALLLPSVFIAIPVMRLKGPDHSRRRIAGTASVIALYSIGFGILSRLHMQNGPWMALAILALCWIGDSTAYFTGIAFGRRKLMPEVSPKKSWEGFYGGIVGGALGCMGVGIIAGFQWMPMLIAGIAGSIAGVGGDLFESALKRDAGVKDSSNILLGHGGIMDRFDSAVAAAPACFAVLYLFGLAG